jgi:hypothetical protein
MYDTLKPGDVVLVDALFDDYFIACELRNRNIDIVARVQHERAGSGTAERRPDGDIILWQRCKTPDMVHKEIWTHLLAHNLLRTVMAMAANENEIEPRKVSFKEAKQALSAFAPKIEAARPENRGRLIDAMLVTIAYHREGDRPGRREPRARKRRPKPAARLTQPRHIAKLPQNRSKWF